MSLQLSKKVYTQLLNVLYALEQSNQLMSEDQLIDETGFVIDAVADRVAKLMGYPQNDFVLFTISECLVDRKPFSEMREMVEGDSEEIEEEFVEINKQGE